jgi:antitoxin (DNA-binding transcriptional repressor) of toxin-antitoxin stability system
LDVSIAEIGGRLSELISAFENGEQVVITRDGIAVAQLAPAPPARRQVRFGTMRGRIHMKPGWDRPLTEDEFLAGNV